MPRRRALNMAGGALLSAAALAGAGCDDGVRTIEGLQPVVVQREVLRPVDAVEVVASRGLNVRVVVTAPPPGRENSDTVVWIEGAGDLMEYVLATVEGSRLRLRIADGVRLSPVPDVEVQVAGLERLHALGSGVVRLEVEEGVVAPRLAIEAVGSVLVEGAGEVRDLAVEATGSGDVHLMALRAEEARYERTGSGDGWVRARTLVRAELTGSGDLHVVGGADCVAETTGSGRVRRVED